MIGQKEEYFCDSYGNCIEGELEMIKNSPSSKYIRYTPVPRQSIEDTAKQVIKLAKDFNKPVLLRLNGVEIMVSPDYEQHIVDLTMASWQALCNNNKLPLDKIIKKTP